MEQSKIDKIVELVEERNSLQAKEQSYSRLKDKAETMIRRADGDCIRNTSMRWRPPHRLAYVKLVLEEGNSSDVELTHEDFFDLVRYAQMRVKECIADINHQLEEL